MNTLPIGIQQTIYDYLNDNNKIKLSLIDGKCDFLYEAVLLCEN